MTEKTLTGNEWCVYKAAMDVCDIEYSTDINQLACDTGLPVPSVKGVVGSLVKKGLLQTEEDDRGGRISDIYPLDKAGKVFSFGEWN